MKLLHYTLASLVFAGASTITRNTSDVQAMLQKVRTPIPLRMNEIVPGQIMVKFTQDRAAKIEQDAAQGRLRPSAVQETFVNRIGETGWTLWSIPLYLDPVAVAQGLMGRADVITAEPVNKVYALTLGDPNDPDYNFVETDPNLILDLNDTSPSFRRMWNMDDINATAGWNLYPGYYPTNAHKPANRPLVAIIDTGADMNHPEFIMPGGKTTDVATGGQLQKSLAAYFNLGVAVKGHSTEDLNGHGTHVAGICIAAANNGAFSSTVHNGIPGVGMNARGMIIRVFDDQGNASDADAAAAIFYAADKGADIINLSLGTTNFSQLFQDAVTYAFQKGTAVFAAGNESGAGGGAMGPIYPAACSGACAVAAAGPGGTPASAYAGSGGYLDVAGPGGNISFAADLSSYSIQYVWSTAMRTPGTLYQMSQSGALFPPYDLNYAYLAGTSMACPHVAGAAALYYGKNALTQAGGWSNVKAYRALEFTAQGYGGSGGPGGAWETNFGYGEIDLQALLSNTESRGSKVGSIQGMVYYNGTALSNVGVKAKIGATTFLTTTFSDGSYRFDSLPPGIATMTAAPFGAFKTKTSVVKAGSDTPGTDFWCGNYTGDTTPATIKLLTVTTTGTHLATAMTVNYCGYDTETGIDKVTIQIGKSSGGSDVLAAKEVPQFDCTAKLTATVPLKKTYYVTAKYTNGAGKVTTKTISVAW